MKTTLLLLACLLATAGQAQTTTRQLWVWKDANGVTHYSDTPAPGAKKIEFAGLTPGATAPPATPSPAPAPTPAPASASASTKPDKPVKVQYRLLEITSPESGATFFGADAPVGVTIRSEPQLAGDDRLLMYLDGALVEDAQNAYTHSFTGLDRGEHTVAAVILDAQGLEKIRSQPCVFYIKSPNLNKTNNVGPALKPPPK